ncbi:MAG TPA: pyridoxal phosphate-dependent aminotransferase [Spirochaetia bacterium]|nr:pyridoxal phosphate-dependent aminotransferase [Spirochaetia bacterium]
MAVSSSILAMMETSSWIRRMFEAGNALRAEHGADRVCDFSLGNPDVEPPAAFQSTLREVVESRIPLKHGYMPNAGYPETRERVAELVSGEQGVTLDGSGVVMSCGASGGLNSALKAILNPGDEVVATTPCFMEYASYVDNHGGTLVLAPSRADFDLDVAALESRIGPRTAAVVVNSPNNPTGRIYPRTTLEQLADMLERAGRKTGRIIYLLADEPYRKLAYDGTEVPGIMRLYPHSVVVTSYSKDLSLPGERIGHVAVCPQADDSKRLVDGIILATRILGYVNAPALMQRTVARIQGLSVDIEVYRKKRDLFCSALRSMGYQFVTPQGAFYIFPRAPGGDDLAFVRTLQEELVLVVPGRGFSLPGFFRIAYCVDTAIIERSLEGFRKAAGKLGL